MLHAFDAETGQEMFAYVPNLVFENLKDLVLTNYTHNFYVDLTPTVTSVDFTSGVTTMLVSGLGGGGKGFYAIDLTSPFSVVDETTLASKVMWEYPRSSTAVSEVDDVGYTYSRTAVVRSNDPSHKWIAIAGNGYNSQSGHAVLLILDLENGTLLKKIDTGVGSCNGLSTPVAIDVPVTSGTAFDDKVDYVYAGDLKGNLWKFDLTSTDYTQWDVAYKSGTTPKPLFQAKGPGGLNQAITTKPDVVFHPEKPGYLVVFGTGKYLGESDIENSSVQTLYAVWDYGDDNNDDEYLGSFQRGATPQLSNQPSSVTLLEQTEVPCNPIDATCDGTLWVVNGQSLRVLTDEKPIWKTYTKNASGICVDGGGGAPCDPDDGVNDKPDPVGGNAGWYFDLPVGGERIVSDVLVREGKLIVLAFRPEDTPCGAGGSTLVMELDLYSGGRLTKAQFDINADKVIDEYDLINIGTAANPIWVAPSGIESAGRLLPPAILRMERDREMKYFSSSRGTIQTIMERSLRLGMSYWLEFQ
jgi:type IV pilus assembly protein PilY1